MTAPLEALTTFIESARWFGGKGRPFEVTDVRRLGWVETGRQRLLIRNLDAVTRRAAG